MNYCYRDVIYENLRSCKKELYETVASVKAEGLMHENISVIIDEVLKDWCGTPPKLPVPWNPDIFIMGIANTISERIKNEIPNASTDKAVMAVIRVVAIIATLASGAHSMGGGD